MLTQKKLKERVHKCYCELFSASTPSADFDKLLAEAEINEQGEKIIDYMAYELDMSRFDEILNSHTKGMSKLQRSQFSQTIYLGCSPKFKQ